MPRWCFRSTVSGMFHARFSTVMARTFAALISWTLVLLSALPIAASAQNAPATVTIDASLNRRPINPNIYGIAHATAAQLNDLNSPLNRNGGNNTTRYNWQLNADNRGQRLVLRKHRRPSAVAGERGDTFISNAQAANAQAMLTIPMIDWVAKLGSNRSQAREFLNRQVRRADRQRLPSGFPTPATAFAPTANLSPATIPTMPTCRRTRRSSNSGCSTWSAAGAPNATAACATTFSTTNPASGTPRIATSIRPARPWTRSGTRSSTTPRKIKAVDPARWSSAPKSGAGAATSTAATTSNTAACTAGASCPTATTTAARIICPGCSISCGKVTSPPVNACSTFSPCTTTRRAASSATTFPAPCNCGAIARRARCGIPTMSTRPGSTIRCS